MGNQLTSHQGGQRHPAQQMNIKQTFEDLKHELRDYATKSREYCQSTIGSLQALKYIDQQ